MFHTNKEPKSKESTVHKAKFKKDIISRHYKKPTIELHGRLSILVMIKITDLIYLDSNTPQKGRIQKCQKSKIKHNAIFTKKLKTSR
jgi:N-formylglutamate amidohydrolase